MARALQKTPIVTPRRSRGFTLVELMIVVAIVGVLAALAVVGYRKLIQSSHVSEATGMVQNIRVAQEGYHSETQQYANISTDSRTGPYYPACPRLSDLDRVGRPCSDCVAERSPGLLCPSTSTARSSSGTRPSPASRATRRRRACRQRLDTRALPGPDDRLVHRRGRRAISTATPTEPNNTHVYTTSWIEPDLRRPRGAITTFTQGNQERKAMRPMRSIVRASKRGFTLIELMIVVAIVGILAVLAIYGVRKYLANAKTAEATERLGQIGQGPVRRVRDGVDAGHGLSAPGVRRPRRTASASRPQTRSRPP